jgi:hypothetical protein
VRGNVYDHIVEQSQMGRSGFSAEQIHNPENLNPVPFRVNHVKANYSSKSVLHWRGDGSGLAFWPTFADQWTLGIKTTQQIFSGEIPGSVGWVG